MTVHSTVHQRQQTLQCRHKSQIKQTALQFKDFRLSVPGEETVKLSKTFDDNGMNVTVKNNSSDSLTIKVTVGVYNDNDTLNTAKLQTVTLDSKAEQTISFAGITSDKSVSIFAWDKDMTPLTNVLQ